MTTAPRRSATSPAPACSSRPWRSADRARAWRLAYDHEARELPKRLTRDFHKHHDLAQATLHVHLDEESCMEVTVLKGRGSDVQRFADHIIAERGVRHGHVVYLPLHKTLSHVATTNRARSSGHQH